MFGRAVEVEIRRLMDRHDSALKLQDERHDRTMEVLNDILKSLKDLRETQIAAKRNGNGSAQAVKVAARKPIVAYPLGIAAGGAAVALLEYLSRLMGGQ